MTHPTTHSASTASSAPTAKVRILHAIIDPLCGWCYAAAPLLVAAAKAGFTIKLHGGGMLTGPRRKQIDANWRDYVMPHDLRIAELTGQPIGENYFDGLLRDTTVVLDSAPPLKPCSQSMRWAAIVWLIYTQYNWPITAMVTAPVMKVISQG